MEEKKFFDKVLDKLEVAGNLLPDPVTIFFILSGLILVLSFVCSKLGISAVNPSTQEVEYVNNLLSMAQLKSYITKIVYVFQTFQPLGVVLVSLIGIGLAEKTGLLEAVLQVAVAKVPSSFIYFTICLLGIMFAGTGDAGFIILPPLTALIFIKIGKNPVAGILMAYAASAAGFSAGVFVGLNDILVTSFTIPAAQILDPSFTASPAMTIFFNITNTLVQVCIITFITKKFIEPRFQNKEFSLEHSKDTELNPLQMKGLKYSGIVSLIFILLIVAASIGDNAFFKDENGSLVSMKSPLMGGLIPLLALGFFLAAFTYGKITKVIKNDKDVVKMISSSLSTMGGYIFIVFASAQFIYLFAQSKLGIIIAIKGANALKELGLTGFPLILLYILLIAFINLFIGSASAKWAILAPIFVPMLMILGFDTAITQQAYRIGDAGTNMISPLFPYVPLLLAEIKKYDKESGLGTLMANMLPYGLVSLVASICLLFIFVMFNIRLGF